MVTKRLIKWSILACLTFLLASCQSVETKTQPNVLLIITDDQGYGDFSCHGNPWLNTPNIDKLYSESTRLTDFHVSPSCTPTRAALLTGQHANRTGCWHTVGGRSQLREGTTTIADVLKDNGYSTAIFGKWHLGDNYPFRPQDRGFEEVLVHGGGGVGQQPDYWNNSYFNDTYHRNGTPEKHEGYCTDVWFSQAKKFISKKTDENKPFFCYLSTNAPHGPYYIGDEYSSKFKNLEGVVNPSYYGMVDNIDQNMGSLMHFMDSLDIADNTIVIFMTDNGVGNGSGMIMDKWNGWAKAGYNAGMRGGKISEYEGGHRVPFFIRWPEGGIKAGTDINQLAGHVDLFPTILQALEISGESIDQKKDGINIWDVITGKQEVNDRVLITDNQRLEKPEKWRGSSTMKGSWRLINGEELYNLDSDKGQRKDIAKDNPEIVHELRNSYEEWWSDLEPSFEHYTAIEFGTEHEPITVINTMDLHVDEGYREVPWHQKHIRKPVLVEGWYAVNFAQEGEYKLTFYRWPPEAKTAINSDLPEFSKIENTSFNGYSAGEAININKMRVVVGEELFEADVDGMKNGAEIIVQAPKGFNKLRTDFITTEGTVFSAFYVKVEKI